MRLEGTHDKGPRGPTHSLLRSSWPRRLVLSVHTCGPVLLSFQVSFTSGTDVVGPTNSTSRVLPAVQTSFSEGPFEMQKAFPCLQWERAGCPPRVLRAVNTAHRPEGGLFQSQPSLKEETEYQNSISQHFSFTNCREMEPKINPSKHLSPISLPGAGQNNVAIAL